MLQLAFRPAYCLTIHKAQALMIRHDVHGCLEGVFALGRVYVLWSRVTSPKLFKAVGVPPADFLNDVARARAAAGMDVDTCLDAAAVVTGQWSYTHAPPGADPCCNVGARLRHVREEEARVKLQLFSVEDILSPQPHAAAVVHALLFRIDEADKTSHRSDAKLRFSRPSGG